MGTVNRLFMTVPEWRQYMVKPLPNGWVEMEFSHQLERSGLRYAYTFLQGWPYAPQLDLVKTDGRLFQDGEEIMMFHFRRYKRWPL